ncbi:mitochondrial protein Pet127-domain-containing protein [Obelidium mucronatum]|nr:mitochondrial protein Pet127-domain-containing protein [Obelidium mucronatum]
MTAHPFRFETVVHEETKHIQVARLAHGLERVLSSPGVHFLKDPRTNYYNFDPFLEKITQPEDFNFDALPPYKVASSDSILKELTQKHGQKYFSSTSSITGLLAKFYHLVAESRGIDKSRFTLPFSTEPENYTAMQRKPTSAILRFHDGVYSVDQEQEDIDPDLPVTPKGNEILMQLGKSLEKLLTATPEEYNTYLKSANLPPDHVFPIDEAFHYANIEGFVLRSQLDCWDDRLPLKTFDIKTRAYRGDVLIHFLFQENTDYKLTTLYGKFCSYEREFFDMTRSTMLKYNLQVRIGKMDGIIVAYHNTKEMFGFQYLSREEMNKVLFGSCKLGDAAFALSCKALESMLDKIVKGRYWGQNLRVTIKAAKNAPEFTIYVEPIADLEKPGASECMGPLTKYRLKVHSNSYSLLKTAETAKRFDPEEWTIDYSMEEVEHRDEPTAEELRILKRTQEKPSEGSEVKQLDAEENGKSDGSVEGSLLDTSTLVSNAFTGDDQVFAGNALEAASPLQQDNHLTGKARSLYVTYTNARAEVPNLNRGKDTRNANYVKSLKKQAREAMKDRYVAYGQEFVDFGGGSGGYQNETRQESPVERGQPLRRQSRNNKNTKK